MPAKKIFPKNTDATPDPPLKATLTAHEANKKEAFDGMRAYHQSEIDHKKDCIDILKTLITTIAVIYAGLIAGVFSQSGLDSRWIFLLGWVIFVMVIISSNTITYLTNKKISQDNNRYKVYMHEYIVERYIINLEKDLQDKGHISHWHKIHENQTNARKSGHNYTKYILIGLNVIVCFVGFMGAMITQFACSAHSSPAVIKQIHIIVDSALRVR